MQVVNNDFELTQINTKISNCISKSSIGNEPLLALINGDSFVPKEGLLWDYKESISPDAAALAKTILQIVSFHNTCGGYIIYGVKELQKDKEFVPVDLDTSQINPAQIRNKINHYTGTTIDFTFQEISYSLGEKNHKAGLLHIPKRDKDSTPVSFIKNGPEKKGKAVFKCDQTYFRHLDECIPATTSKDWQTLFSARKFNPAYGLENTAIDKDVSRVTHNLPDKNLICSRFIGREELLTQLWEWLSDDLEYTKILSGDGGKGKTSIAYHFCRDFIQSPPSGYERVVWMSAKEMQFSGINNQYFELQESDFNNCESFLSVLADNCALDSDDYENISSKKIKRDLKTALTVFPAIYVVDDIDSLQDDEQRKVVDACRQLGSDNSRFLITTRKKLAYSSDLCIDVPGFPLNDFKLYINSLIEKYDLKSIKPSQISNLHNTCDGSPLLASSILRLYKQGIPFSQAIKDWKGEAGEDARSAALKREILSLTAESKRVLLAIYYFGNCSFTELKQTIGTEKLKLVDCLEELQSLFLVSEPKLIENEERFSISNTTALIVSELEREMAYDHKKLHASIKLSKEGPSTKKSGNTRKIGLAINQALALIRDDRVKDAIDTVDQQLRFFSGNPDLLLMKARCLMNLDKPDYSAASDLLRKSYDAGQRKELVCELWYECESKLESSNGIIEVSQKALDQEDYDKKSWYERLAFGLVLRWKHRDSNPEINDLMEASQALTHSLNYLDKTSKEMRLEELNSLHNLIWSNIEHSNTYSWLSCFDIVYELLCRGDIRTNTIFNAHRCLKESIAEGKLTDGKREAFNICVEKLRNLLDSRSAKDKSDRPFLEIKDNLIKI